MADLLTWTVENSVGVVGIDSQHRHIFSLINSLANSISQNKSQPDIDKVLNSLIDYSKVHFGTEEKYFKLFNYIGASDHIAKHRVFIDKVFEFYDLRKDPKEREKLPYEIIDFLKQWWLFHINTEDKKYTETFHNHGLF